MKSSVLFAPIAFKSYHASETLPAKFERLLDASPLAAAVKGKKTAVKMHLGRSIGYATIHPMFVEILISKLKEYGADVFITDHIIGNARSRGYTEEALGCPIIPCCGEDGKYYYEKDVDFKSFHKVDVAGHIHDAEVLIDLSHVKGHGVCGFGGAVKNISMGCVSDRTRRQIHSLEGGLEWDDGKCIRCGVCVDNCNHSALSFENDRLKMNQHHCTSCQHCVKTCPTGAFQLDAGRFEDFQHGMALCTQKCLENFAPRSVYYINFLMNITALCDCWGFTTPDIVPDIGILASDDIVAIEHASLALIKTENFLPAGVPVGYELGDKGHLFERIHGKDPYVQLRALEKIGLGSFDYGVTEIE